MVVMMDKNFNKYDLKDIIIMLKKHIVILILLIFMQLMAIFAYNYNVKQTYNITLKFTALDFLAYEKLKCISTNQ